MSCCTQCTVESPASPGQEGKGIGGVMVTIWWRYTVVITFQIWDQFLWEYKIMLVSLSYFVNNWIWSGIFNLVLLFQNMRKSVDVIKASLSAFCNCLKPQNFLYLPTQWWPSGSRREMEHLALLNILEHSSWSLLWLLCEIMQIY